MKIFESIIKSESLVFDVGSNVGEKSQTFLNLGATVIAFEPQYECFIQANNKFQVNPKYRSENIALDNKVGTSIMYVASYHTISSMSEKFIEESKKERFVGYSWNNTIEVRTDTFDNMIDKYGFPDFIKIDVEGYEFSVLSGLTRPVNIISIEFNPELCDETLKCIDYIDNLNNGNTVFNYGYRSDEDFKYETWVSKDTIVEYLKSVNDFKFEFGDVYCKKV